MDAISLDFRLTCRRGLDALLLAAPLGLGLVLLARRLAGALVEPLPLAGWLFMGLAVALWLRWFHAWLPERPTAAFAGWRTKTWLAPALGCLIGLVLWLPGTPASGIICFAAIVLVGGARSGVKRSRGARPARPRPDASPPAASPSSADPLDEPAGDGFEESSAAPPLAPTVIQQMIRRREPGQAESLQGSLRTEFAAGQRTASAHVAICPPFELAPHCQAAVAAGPQAEVRVATALPFGVRFEIKLARAAAEPTDVVIEFAIDSTDAG
jgi:hypothetical protein